jgi:hypothetical protein
MKIGSRRIKLVVPWTGEARTAYRILLERNSWKKATWKTKKETRE